MTTAERETSPRAAGLNKDEIAEAVYIARRGAHTREPGVIKRGARAALSCRVRVESGLVAT